MPKTYHDLTENQRGCLRDAVARRNQGRKFRHYKYHHKTIPSLERAGLLRWTPLYGGSYQATDAGMEIMKEETE
jgi:hypothetical protein